MNSEELVCWRCGASLAALSLPIGRRDECPECHAELHVCQLCAFHDPRVAKQCREPVADEVRDKDRANFCGYFQPGPDAHRGGGKPESQSARGELESLFGGEPAPASPPSGKEALEKLFKS
jgi:ribosomal protein L40E